MRSDGRHGHILRRDPGARLPICTNQRFSVPLERHEPMCVSENAYLYRYRKLMLYDEQIQSKSECAISMPLKSCFV